MSEIVQHGSVCVSNQGVVIKDFAFTGEQLTSLNAGVLAAEWAIAELQIAIATVLKQPPCATLKE